VILMSNRESLIPTFIGGVRGKVHDYSVSICGISPVARRQWMYARSRGHQVAAKMQINNSWECSTIPYLPVYSLLVQNVQELAEAGVEHLMLSWTLGGYPSPSIKVVSELFFETMGEEESVDLGKVYRSLYGDYAKQVQEAADVFSDAFKEFPFDIQTLYVGPQNGGASNLLFAKPTGLAATMTCYAYDDLAAWQAMYPEDIFENQFKVLCDKWKLGLDRLADMPECEFKDIAHATYIQFKASYNQIRFIRCRDRYLSEGGTQAKEIIQQVLCNETELAKELYHIMRRNPSIGFEAANHYYYTQGMLLEKVLNCAHIAAELAQ